MLLNTRKHSQYSDHPRKNSASNRYQNAQTPKYQTFKENEPFCDVDESLTFVSSFSLSPSLSCSQENIVPNKATYTLKRQIYLS